jgi:hypothetical protein
MTNRINNDLQNTPQKTKDRVTRISLITGGEPRCSGRVSSSCSTRGTRHVTLGTNPMISHEWGKDRGVLTTSGTYRWSIVTQIFRNGQPTHGGDRKTFEVMTSTQPIVFMNLLIFKGVLLLERRCPIEYLWKCIPLFVTIFTHTKRRKLICVLGIFIVWSLI